MRVLWDIVTRRWIRGGVGNRLPKKYGKVLGMSGGFSVERLRTPWRLEFRRPARQGLRPNLLCRFPVFPPSAQSPGAPEQTPRPRGGVDLFSMVSFDRARSPAGSKVQGRG